MKQHQHNNSCIYDEIWGWSCTNAMYLDAAIEFSNAIHLSKYDSSELKLAPISDIFVDVGHGK